MEKKTLQNILDLKAKDEIKTAIIKEVLRFELKHHSYQEITRRLASIDEDEETNSLYREALKSVLLELKIQKLGKLDLDTVAEISKDIESDTKTTRQFIEETRSDFLQEPDNKKKTF